MVVRTHRRNRTNTRQACFERGYFTNTRARTAKQLAFCSWRRDLGLFSVGVYIVVLEAPKGQFEGNVDTREPPQLNPPSTVGPRRRGTRQSLSGADNPRFPFHERQHFQQSTVFSRWHKPPLTLRTANSHVVWHPYGETSTIEYKNRRAAAGVGAWANKAYIEGARESL